MSGNDSSRNRKYTRSRDLYKASSAYQEQQEQTNPLNNMFLRHSKVMSYVSLECFHNTSFHFIETLKVRGMARNLRTGDVSMYFANQVQTKPLISGVVSGFFGAAIGSLTFMMSHNVLTKKIYAEEKLSWLTNRDFRVKNLIIFLISDITASLTKFPFEARKQMVQMANYEIKLNILMRNAYLGLVPLMVRDVSFRFMILSSYYATTNIDHKPQLKYSVPQILNFRRQRLEEGYEDSLKDLQQQLYEYHNYTIKTPYTTRLTVLILSNLVATILTNPIDVCVAKIMTQNPKSDEVKYKGLLDALRKVYKEEGREKFLSGLHPRFMFNLINGLMFLFVYDRFQDFVNQIYM